MRGYFGIGIENTKTPANLGTLWRSAFNFDAAFLFTIHRRYPQQGSDTVKAWRHVPLYEYDTIAQFVAAIPRDCEVVGVELDADAKPLGEFRHMERSIYVLGAEDSGLSAPMKQVCRRVVQIESKRCLNVAVAGSIVMWHRNQQMV